MSHDPVADSGVGWGPGERDWWLKERGKGSKGKSGSDHWMMSSPTGEGEGNENHGYFTPQLALTLLFLSQFFFFFECCALTRKCGVDGSRHYSHKKVT